jgi:hypothetical protein
MLKKEMKKFPFSLVRKIDFDPDPDSELLKKAYSELNKSFRRNTLLYIS